MSKSLFLLVQVWKVLGLACLIVIAFSCLLNLLTGNGLESVLDFAKVIAAVFAILAVLSTPTLTVLEKSLPCVKNLIK